MIEGDGERKRESEEYRERENGRKIINYSWLYEDRVIINEIKIE